MILLNGLKKKLIILYLLNKVKNGNSTFKNVIFVSMYYALFFC